MTNSVLGVRTIQHTNGTDAMTIASDGSVTFAAGTSYRPGEIIEMLSHSCDGTTMTGAGNRTYTWPNVTAIQAMTTSYQDITGSSITYTPPTGTKTVVYRFVWKWQDDALGGISHWKFMIDSTEVVSAYRCIAMQYESNAHGEIMQVFEYSIDCAAASTDASAAKFESWTSDKTLKWQGREYGSGYQATVHKNTWRDGGSASGAQIIAVPTLTITAIA
ncbi:MAG: hypothetical protein CMO44_00805 [Verrucomicrobiales bacterium]|nr:hypothetical protein [Verrucomicrobiales bacterium]|tara:strand:+ start:1349 stop:2002 length:654 start_codon:yes stop_codon:yes gene_type:complete